MCSRNARWNETFPRTPSYRQVTPPQPVSINLDQALARDNPPLRTTNPLRVTAGGLQLTEGFLALGVVPGRSGRGLLRRREALREVVGQLA